MHRSRQRVHGTALRHRPISDHDRAQWRRRVDTRPTPLWAVTAGGAAALRRTDIGHPGIGARADLAVVEAPSYRHLAYRPGVPLVQTLENAGM